jgi:hypothetical protein
MPLVDGIMVLGPGSAQLQAAYAIWSHSSAARMVFIGLGSRPSAFAVLFSMRPYRFQSPSFFTASIKELGMRTELLLFWPLTVL